MDLAGRTPLTTGLPITLCSRLSSPAAVVGTLPAWSALQHGTILSRCYHILLPINTPSITECTPIAVHMRAGGVEQTV